MPEFSYAKGRILDSIAFITAEMKEFDTEYSEKTYREYSVDNKLQKIIDRTAENILTAIIEISGTVLAENGIKLDSYTEVMRKIGSFFKFSDEECDILSSFATQRNRLAHRYLNFRWQVIKFYKDNNNVLKKLVTAIYEYEKSKE
ncbi:MAG: HepT-like ribonuclease domain-containing protein [Spirochaetota bacterium]